MSGKNKRIKKRDPGEDLKSMEEAGELSLTILDCLIIEDAVKGEEKRNARATGAYGAITNPKIA